VICPCELPQGQLLQCQWPLPDTTTSPRSFTEHDAGGQALAEQMETPGKKIWRRVPVTGWITLRSDRINSSRKKPVMYATKVEDEEVVRLTMEQKSSEFIPPHGLGVVQEQGEEEEEEEEEADEEADEEEAKTVQIPEGEPPEEVDAADRTLEASDTDDASQADTESVASALEMAPPGEEEEEEEDGGGVVSPPVAKWAAGKTLAAGQLPAPSQRAARCKMLTSAIGVAGPALSAQGERVGVLVPVAADQGGEIAAEIAGWLAGHAAETELPPSDDPLRVGDSWVLRQSCLGQAAGHEAGWFDAALAFAVVGVGLGREPLQTAVRACGHWPARAHRPP
jgi:hypothetical protein